MSEWFSCRCWGHFGPRPGLDTVLGLVDRGTRVFDRLDVAILDSLTITAFGIPSAFGNSHWVHFKYCHQRVFKNTKHPLQFQVRSLFQCGSPGNLQYDTLLYGTLCLIWDCWLVAMGSEGDDIDNVWGRTIFVGPQPYALRIARRLFLHTACWCWPLAAEPLDAQTSDSCVAFG